MTNADDATILAVLDAVPNLNVWDGNVSDSDPTAHEVNVALPYLAFYSTPGTDEAESLSGSANKRLAEFQLTFVGETREQALWAGEKARAVLNRQFITFASGPRFVRRTDDNRYIQRDDTWTRPGGGPLFYGIDRYAVLI